MFFRIPFGVDGNPSYEIAYAGDSMTSFVRIQYFHGVVFDPKSRMYFVCVPGRSRMIRVPLGPQRKSQIVFYDCERFGNAFTVTAGK